MVISIIVNKAKTKGPPIPPIKKHHPSRVIFIPFRSGPPGALGLTPINPSWPPEGEGGHC